MISFLLSILALVAGYFIYGRIVEKVVELPVGRNSIHELTLHPRHPGIVFEKIVIDFGGYKPSYLFGHESEATRGAKK
jgi:hypothetical protein